jgi:hypothetical protein
VATYPVLEHGERPTSRWLRENRFRIAFLVAAVETVLVVFDALQWRWVVLLAAMVFAFHFFLGRKARFRTIRELSWTAVIAQAIPVFIPFVIAVSLTLAVLAIVGVAVVVLLLVLLGRR